MKRLADRARLLIYSAGWSAVHAMPERMAYALFRSLADLAWLRRSRPTRRLERNLARVVPDATADELRALSRAGLRSYMRYWCDAFRIDGWTQQRLSERVRTRRLDRITEPLQEGRGVIVALPHMANWDHAGAWACMNLGQVASVAERLKPEELFERFLAYRERLGMKIWPVGGQDVNVMTELAAHVQRGGLVCLPAERDLSRRGITVTFFGEQTRMPAGPAMLALRTGATLVPMTLSYEGREPDHGIVLTFHDPIEIPAERTSSPGRIATMTQQVASAFEVGISQHPEDWHMTQRLFLSDLDTSGRRGRPSDELVAP
ncbi:phosphatidylinositol mannoside acyltransferase [Actinobacteria bacterium YIM 96077]|uniref:Phosphatidylinositol mannoside acyltransferase n=1 Tax=Phytoactinopolyspora halophila TaxID=1981511 RepID=A0A329R0D1_9ACTN|nr:phosphatidylinositol mannoside acyltransferase [Phytoactinopolyspora halophila]AYY13326.1 phosphatidylinositol mannoside acyltransferase [Actinobacteria bacterium YIM 96077]RAW17439.1 phosphatidylinositol mannoside acyltransferase [Phytoactinopolyspora halophila]